MANMDDYVKTSWVNNTTPAINATNLNHIEQGVFDNRRQINENISAIDDLDLSKQDNLTFDNAPTLGSTNPVTSGGVYNAIQGVVAEEITDVKVNGTSLAKTNNSVNVPVPVTGIQFWTVGQYPSGESRDYYSLDGLSSGNPVTLIFPGVDSSGFIKYQNLPSATASQRGAVTVAKNDPGMRYATIGYGSTTVQIPWVSVDSNNNVTSKIRADFIPTMPVDAMDVAYDNVTASSFTSTDVQGALDETSFRLEALEEMIAPIETAFVATRNYMVNDLVIVNNTLYKVTANIASGATITPNTNVTQTTLSALFRALSS